MNGKQDLEETIHQLQASGVLFCIEYVGSVVVEKSINSLSAEKQAEVARACMRFVVRNAVPSLKTTIGKGEGEEQDENEEEEEEEAMSTYVHGPVQAHRRDIEMNISSTAIILIDGNPIRPLHRFKIQDVSLLSPGFNELSSFFCFFTKVQVPGQPQQWLRKCFVFNAKSEMEDVRDVICFAFRLNEHNNIRRDSQVVMMEGGDGGGGGDAGEEMATPRPPATPPTPVGREFANAGGGCGGPSTSSGGGDNAGGIPEIRIAERDEMVPTRPRRYTTSGGNGGGNNGGGTLMPAQRQGRSGTMESGSGGGTRSSSISPRADISVQISPDRYKELTRDLSVQNWFHGVLPRLKADSLIRANNQFLVRQSPNIADQFVLVGMYDDRVRHVCLISRDGKIQTTIGEFRSIVDLIKYFHHSRTPMMLHGEQLQLHHPVNRQQPPPPPP